MKKELLAALLAAVSFVPVAAAAQDRPDRGPRAERGEGRQGGWGERRASGGDQARQQRAPQAQAADRAPQASRPFGWLRRDGDNPQQRFRPAPTNADPARQAYRQERRDDRRDFAAERLRDRQALQNGDVNRRAFAADRQRDRQVFQNDRAQDRRDFRRDNRDDGVRTRQWNNGTDWNRGRNDWNDQRRGYGNRDSWSDQRRWGNDRGGWNRDWRRDTRYDWNRYRYQNRNAFRLPRYYAPYGWNYGYRQFGVGAILSQSLFAHDYWIDDPWSYRLPDADGPYRWVRYYNDALLVDVYSGEVVDVIRDIFW